LHDKVLNWFTIDKIIHQYEKLYSDVIKTD
jgi:hypothetical protein